MYQYAATVKRIIDGDTYELEVDLGFGIIKTDKFRLLGIDTPETWRPSCDNEELHGQQARYFVHDAIMDKLIYIETSKTGKYGRYLCNVTYDGDKDLCEELKKAGFEKLESYE